MTAFDPTTTSIDYVLIAGKRTPGIAEVVGADSPVKWDERRGYGLSGSTVFFAGIGLSKFSVKLRLYTSTDWADWDAFRPTVQKVQISQRGDGLFQTKALAIWHPWLEQLGITSVVIENVLEPVLTQESGEWTIEIKCIQFRQPKPQFAKPTASKSEPTDPVEARIKQLTENNQQLMAQLHQELAK